MVCRYQMGAYSAEHSSSPRPEGGGQFFFGPTIAEPRPVDELLHFLRRRVDTLYGKLGLSKSITGVRNVSQRCQQRRSEPSSASTFQRRIRAGGSKRNSRDDAP